MIDNPQAFPWYIQTNGSTTDGRSGMTLRDYFAGQALGVGFAYSPDDPKEAAARAYAAADAMLAERSKP